MGTIFESCRTCEGIALVRNDPVVSTQVTEYVSINPAIPAADDTLPYEVQWRLDRMYETELRNRWLGPRSDIFDDIDTSMIFTKSVEAFIRFLIYRESYH